MPSVLSEICKKTATFCPFVSFHVIIHDVAENSTFAVGNVQVYVCRRIEIITHSLHPNFFDGPATSPQVEGLPGTAWQRRGFVIMTDAGWVLDGTTNCEKIADEILMCVQPARYVVDIFALELLLYYT